MSGKTLGISACLPGIVFYTKTMVDYFKMTVQMFF